jgi:hypothetical protein
MLLTSKGRRDLGATEGGARLLALRREADQRIPTPAEARQRLKGHAVAKWEEEGRRVSPVVEVAMLLAECIRHGLRTIAFCKSRKLCELVATYVHERLRCYPLLASSFKVDKPHQRDAVVMLDSLTVSKSRDLFANWGACNLYSTLPLTTASSECPLALSYRYTEGVTHRLSDEKSRRDFSRALCSASLPPTLWS